MRDARWIPEENRHPTYERPRLHAPSPYSGDWLENPQAAEAADDEEQPRVIIIDM